MFEFLVKTEPEGELLGRAELGFLIHDFDEFQVFNLPLTSCKYKGASILLELFVSQDTPDPDAIVQNEYQLEENSNLLQNYVELVG